MAIVKTTENKINSADSVSAALNYTTNPEKVFAVSCENCCGDSKEIAEQFAVTRKSFHQDNKILAHHFVQSFSPDDNVTPELAHKIGVELARKVFPNYQVVISTHKDQNHLHNHIVVNSCNIKTGYKYHDNKASLAAVQNESDMLCQKYNLSVIDKENRGKSLDQTTYQLAKKGKSWKVELINDLDNAVKCCKSKLDFIDYLNKRSYDVRYTDCHITIKKRGEKKGIRVDTLAKQFGEQYSKENLETVMGFFTVPPLRSDVVPSENKIISPAAGEWERYEQWYMKKLSGAFALLQTSELPTGAVRSFEENKLSFTKRLYLYFVLKGEKARSKKIRRSKMKSVQLNSAPPKTPENFKRIGNVSYRQLTAAAGDNYYIKITALQLAKLIGKPIFYSAKVNLSDGTATVTVKKKDKLKLAKLLGINDWRTMDKQNSALENNISYKQIKADAVAAGSKPEYLIVTPEQLDKLQKDKVPLAYFAKATNFNICFLPEYKERISKLLHTEATAKQESDFVKNNRINNELKITAAKTGNKVTYKVVPEDVAAAIRNADITAAIFPKRNNKGYSNVVYLKSDAEKINKVINDFSSERRV